MARAARSPVDDYIASRPRAQQRVLAEVRRALRKALPDAEEVISYKVPAFRTRAGVIVYFAGWKAHYSLYPSSERLVETFSRELAGCTFSKGTIRFPIEKPVPARLISRIAKFRAREVAARAEAKARARKAR